MTNDLLVIGGIILLLLVLSGFFSSSETALTAVSRARMHRLAKQGDRRAAVVLSLMDHRDRLIGAILLGNNLVNILASTLAASLFLSLFGPAGIAYATLVMTFLVLVFAEVLPKTYALSNPDGLALTVANAMRFISWLLGPLTMALQVLVRGTLRIFGITLDPTQDEEEKEQELRGAIDLHHQGGEVRKERAMLNSILDLDDVEVSEIMTHRSHVIMLDAAKSPQENIDTILESRFTRLPIFSENPDNIVGVLHVKALLKGLNKTHNNSNAMDLISLAKPAWFIPENTSLIDQLEAFRVRQEHFAIVVDEYASFMGIVTLEDILEEIVGDISDEHDLTVPGVSPKADGSYIVDGMVTIRDLNRDMEWNLPDDDAATIAGLVLHEARMVPEQGQRFSFHGFRIEIIQRQRNRITRLKVTPP